MPSGMAPQFTAMYLACLRELNSCIIWGRTPCRCHSPVTSTDRSIGATRMARSTAAMRAGALPMMPKRCLARSIWGDIAGVESVLFI